MRKGVKSFEKLLERCPLIMHCIQENYPNAFLTISGYRKEIAHALKRHAEYLMIPCIIQELNHI